MYLLVWRELLPDLADTIELFQDYDNFSEAEFHYKEVLKKDYVTQAYLTEIIQDSNLWLEEECKTFQMLLWIKCR